MQPGKSITKIHTCSDAIVSERMADMLDVGPVLPVMLQRLAMERE